MQRTTSASTEKSDAVRVMLGNNRERDASDDSVGSQNPEDTLDLSGSGTTSRVTVSLNRQDHSEGVDDSEENCRERSGSRELDPGSREDSVSGENIPPLLPGVKSTDKITRVQYAAQLLYWGTEAFAFGQTIGSAALAPLFDKTGEPSPAAKVALFSGAMVLNYYAARNLLRPLLTKLHPYKDVQRNGVLRNFGILALTTGAGYGLGCIGAVASLAENMGGAAIISTASFAVMHGLTYKLRPELEPLKPEVKDPGLNWAQKGGQHVLHFAGAFAVKEMVRFALINAGVTTLVSSPFLPLMLLGAYVCMRGLDYFSNQVEPLRALAIEDEYAVTQESNSFKSFSPAAEGSRIPTNQAGYDSLGETNLARDPYSFSGETVRDRQQGHLVSVADDEFGAPSDQISTEVTNSNKAKAVVNHSAVYVLSAALVTLTNYLFLQGSWFQDLTTADRDLDTKNGDAFGLRFALDFVRLTGFALFTAGLHLAKNKASLWCEARQARPSITATVGPIGDRSRNATVDCGLLHAPVDAEGALAHRPTVV